MSLFSANEWQRYQRQVQLPGFGAAGQTRLKQARVLIVGIGGLGCPAAQYLAAAGVGTITLVDGDVVSRSNLQRQVLFGEADVGQPKAAIARQRLLANNPTIQVAAVAEHFSEANADKLLAGITLALDCSDNFTARYLLNNHCLQQQIAWVYASVIRFSGQLALFTPGNACYQCLFPQPAATVEDCNSAGVLGSLPGVLGTLQATEALKFLAGLEDTLANQLLLVEGLTNNISRLQLAVNPACFCQGGATAPIAAAPHCATSEPANAISRAAFARLIAAATTQLIDVRSEAEHQAFNIGGRCLPLDKLQAALPLPKAQTIALYCQSGLRSSQAGELLAAAGYANVVSLQGGLARWLEGE